MKQREVARSRRRTLTLPPAAEPPDTPADVDRYDRRRTNACGGTRGENYLQASEQPRRVGQNPHGNCNISHDASLQSGIGRVVSIAGRQSQRKPHRAARARRRCGNRSAGADQTSRAGRNPLGKIEPRRFRCSNSNNIKAAPAALPDQGWGAAVQIIEAVAEQAQGLVDEGHACRNCRGTLSRVQRRLKHD